MECRIFAELIPCFCLNFPARTEHLTAKHCVKAESSRVGYFEHLPPSLNKEERSARYAAELSLIQAPGLTLTAHPRTSMTEQNLSRMNISLHLEIHEVVISHQSMQRHFEECHNVRHGRRTISQRLFHDHKHSQAQRQQYHIIRR